MSTASLQLLKGKTYNVVDWYGMLSFDGEYKGVIRDKENHGPEIALFKYTSHDGETRYAGALPQASFGRSFSDKPDSMGVYLRAEYYGASPETLKHVARHPKLPRWEIES